MSSVDIPMKQRLWSPLVRDLVPYVPGEQPKINNLIKLNTNESPFPPSPKVREAVISALGSDGDILRLYPDPDASSLKQVIATYHGLATNQVFLGNGSDEVLAHIYTAFFKQSLPILSPDISYSFYPVYSQLYAVETVQIPLNADFRIDVNDYKIPNGGVILANPNAPTGVLLTLDQIRQLLSNNPESVVVIDEAYIDFGGQSAITLINEFDNLVVCHTVSKSRALAGLRIGVVFGQAHLIEALERVKNSFNSYPLDRLAIAGGVASFEDDTYFQSTCQALIDLREDLVSKLQGLGFDVLPSHANFIFARHPQYEAVTLAKGLRESGIIVRHFAKPRIDQFLRITIGTAEQNQALVSRLQEIL
ncbi:histidinol-phosphate transaminase [Aquirhabdus sp.]|uniref:histidinol-phosphate transaminase n=1 Tax=Aquirhabdus sp. TaxID=2824160 RepID=UPI00396CF569